MKKVIQTGLITFILSGVAYASDVNSTEEKSVPQNWWQMGSYDYPQSDELLTYLSGSVGYTRSEGNERNDNLKISVAAIARKGNLTFASTYEKNKWTRRMYDAKNLPPRELSNDRYAIENTLIYDMNSYLFGAVGYENGRNLEMAIYNRNVRYAGVGVRAIKTDHHKLNLFAGLGDEYVSFGLYPMLPSGTTNLMYYQLNYLWLMNDNFSLSTKYTLLKADMAYRDNSKFDISANIKITKYFSWVVSYQDIGNKAMDTVNLFTHDKTVNSSLQVSF